MSENISCTVDATRRQVFLVWKGNQVSQGCEHAILQQNKYAKYHA